MEKRLSCSLILSLQEMAFRRLPIIFLNGSDILDLIARFNCEIDDSGTHNMATCTKISQEIVENKIKDKVLNLQLPESLSKEVIRVVKPICSEILSWKMFHREILNSSDVIDVPLLKLLVWTSTGTIDYGQTAEQMVRLEILDVMKRFRLACLYCLVNHISHLWNELPGDSKKLLRGEDFTAYNTASMNRRDSQIDKHFELMYWICVLTGDEARLKYIYYRLGNLEFKDALHQFFLQYSARIGNRRAADFFFQKLTYEERDTSFFRIACSVIEGSYILSSSCLRESVMLPHHFPDEKKSDVICYLLSKMSLEQQMHVLKENPWKVLLCLLHWPWQDLLVDIADVIWSFIPESSYDIICMHIIRKFELSDIDYFIPCIFQKFFLSSCSNFKKHFMGREYNYPYFFAEFCKAEDTETIKLVLRNVDAEDRVRLLCCYHFFHLLDDLIMKGKWHLVEFCLQECTVSKEDRERVKKIFMGFLTLRDTHEMVSENPKWKRFFQFFDETDENSSSKRSSEDETQTKVKKPRSENEKNDLP